jgi:predicted Fe-S protein YdhL (DUF1289 family)
VNNINNIKSPCIHVCTNDTNDICLGCYRSVEEIRKWYLCSDEEKLKIIRNAEKRRAQKDQNDQFGHYV